jgi:hypothetical protein
LIGIYREKQRARQRLLTFQPRRPRRSPTSY